MKPEEIAEIKERWSGDLPRAVLSRHAKTDIDFLLTALEESQRRERESRTEIEGVLESLGPLAIRIRENGGAEDIYASLAVSVARLSVERNK